MKNDVTGRKVTFSTRSPKPDSPPPPSAYQIVGRLAGHTLVQVPSRNSPWERRYSSEYTDEVFEYDGEVFEYDGEVVKPFSVFEYLPDQLYGCMIPRWIRLDERFTMVVLWAQSVNCLMRYSFEYTDDVYFPLGTCANKEEVGGMRLAGVVRLPLVWVVLGACGTSGTCGGCVLILHVDACCPCESVWYLPPVVVVRRCGAHGGCAAGCATGAWMCGG